MLKRPLRYLTAGSCFPALRSTSAVVNDHVLRPLPLAVVIHGQVQEPADDGHLDIILQLIKNPTEGVDIRQETSNFNVVVPFDRAKLSDLLVSPFGGSGSGGSVCIDWDTLTGSAVNLEKSEAREPNLFVCGDWISLTELLAVAPIIEPENFLGFWLSTPAVSHSRLCRCPRISLGPKIS